PRRFSVGFRETEGKLAAMSRFALHPNPATVLFDELLTEYESQARSLLVCCSACGIGGCFVEKNLHHLVIHSDAVVGHVNVPFCADFECADNNFAAVVGEFQG